MALNQTAVRLRRAQPPFNSLFEMQEFDPEHDDFIPYYCPFNSLFEMRRRGIVAIHEINMSAFNSLFEMRETAACAL